MDNGHRCLFQLSYPDTLRHCLVVVVLLSNDSCSRFPSHGLMWLQGAFEGTVHIKLLAQAPHVGSAP